MKYSMLMEALSLLQDMRSQQSNTGGCVTKCLDQVIRNLGALKGEKVSEPEMNAMILQELGRLFLEFPELQEQLEYLAGL